MNLSSFKDELHGKNKAMDVIRLLLCHNEINSLLVGLVVAIVVMILMISKFKIHPFISMMAVSIALAVFALPIETVAGVINEGFGNTMRGIGIVIILGALIGFIVEKTGAAVKIADVVVKLVGKKHPELAMLLMGWIVSIPVFCDSGFVILNPIRKSFTQNDQEIIRRDDRCALTWFVCLSRVYSPNPRPHRGGRIGWISGQYLTRHGNGCIDFDLRISSVLFLCPLHWSQSENS